MEVDPEAVKKAKKWEKAKRKRARKQKAEKKARRTKRNEGGGAKLDPSSSGRSLGSDNR